jgi:hypothetical protein
MQLTKRRKIRKKAAVKAAKKEAKLAIKANKSIPEEILTVDHVVDPENRNEMVINEEPAVEILDDYLDGVLGEIREAESQPSLDVENVTSEEPENIVSTPITEVNMSEYDPYDTTYLDDLESDDEECNENSVDSPENEISSEDIKSEVDDGSYDDNAREVVEVVPVKVKTAKGKVYIEKVKTQKRKLNFSVTDIVMNNKKRKLSFKIVDNVVNSVKKSKGL